MMLLILAALALIVAVLIAIFADEEKPFAAFPLVIACICGFIGSDSQFGTESYEQREVVFRSTGEPAVWVERFGNLRRVPVGISDWEKIKAGDTVQIRVGQGWWTGGETEFVFAENQPRLRGESN